jgi:hypothetical protein
MQAGEAAAAEAHTTIMESGQDRLMDKAQQVNKEMEERAGDVLNDMMEEVQFNKSYT